MLDIRIIRTDAELVRDNLRKRRNPENLEMLQRLIQSDKRWRQLLRKVNELRHERKVLTIEVAALKKKGKSADAVISKAREIDLEITALQMQVKKLEYKSKCRLMKIPNLLHKSVPIGKDENDNVPIRKWGEPKEFSFSVKNHIDLALDLDLIDVERAGKVAGARFFYLKNEGVLLDMALMNFALEEMIAKGYTPIEPPFFMKRKAYKGVVVLSDFEKDLYKVENEDLYLIATSEHPMAAMFMDEVLMEEHLPLRFVGISANFRKEAGSHGKDTRGIFRTHQFNKVEQFVFCKPEDSWKMHEELIQNTEEIVQKLGLPYQVVNVCTGDIGTVPAKKYDLEVWFQAQNAYREVVSCSNCTDYQARRLNIRYREKEGASPKGFVHTLNSTALATGRTIVAILENQQQQDGSVIIPEILRKYMGRIEEITPKR